MNEHNELLQDLDVAFRMISSIAVSGDAVDAIAVARSKIRKVCEELSKKTTTEEQE
jgi:hypothetical protein